MRSLLVVLAFWGLATAVCAQHKTSSVQVNVVATTDTLCGFQLSLLNAANKTYGVQLSPLINVAHYFLTSSSCHPKFFIKEFGDFLMPCHQHCLGVNLLVQR